MTKIRRIAGALACVATLVATLTTEFTRTETWPSVICAIWPTSAARAVATAEARVITPVAT